MAYTDPVTKPVEDTTLPDAGGAPVKKPMAPIGAAPATTAVSNPVTPAPSIVPPATTADPMAFHPETNPVLKDTPPLGAPSGGLDPAVTQQYRSTMAGVSPLGSDPVSEEFIKADIARTQAAQAAGSQPGYTNITPEQRDAMPLEQQIAQGYFVQGDPNNKGFGGTPGVDPTGGAPARFLQGGLEQYADGSAVPGGYNAQTDAKQQLAAQGYGSMNVDQLGNWSNGGGQGASPGILSSLLAGGGATDTGGNAPTKPMTLGGPSASPSPSAPPASAGAPTDPYRGGITNTDPNDSLLGKTLLAGPETDRYGIASDRLKTWDAASEPYFKANLREAGQQAAGRGQLFSGQLRGRLGDITQQHDLERTNAGQGFLQNALEGSIGDAYKNIGIAQDAQKFQQGQQESAFGQQVVQTQVEEALRNGDFQRAMQLLQAGNQGNPSDTALALSGIFGGQAGAANSALGGLIGNTTANNAAKNNQGLPPWLMQYLQQIGGGSSQNQNPGGDDGQ